jgi:anti-sigma factor RsiW
MKAQKCYTTEQLAEYSLGMGNEAWRNGVEAHLTECSACKKELASLVDAGVLLDKFPTHKAPDLWENIAQNLTPRRQSLLHWIPTSGRPLYASLALGVLVVIVAISVWLVPVHKSGSQQTAFKFEQMDSHSTMLWNDPFADRVSLVVYNAASDEKVVD